MYFRYASWIIDAMDATKCTIPWIHQKPKSWETAKKLLSQFVACIQHGVGTRMFAFDEELKKDGDLMCTLILRMLVDEKNRRDAVGLPWPEVLYIQGDNASDNKNKGLFQICELLVRLKIFRKVKFSFLPVGHTHEDVDACFGAGSHMLRRMSAMTLSDVCKVWKRGWPSTLSFDYVHVGSPRVHFCIVCQSAKLRKVLYLVVVFLRRNLDVPRSYGPTSMRASEEPSTLE